MNKKEPLKKPSKTKKRTKKNTKSLKKGDATPQKIINAARKVFARHSYNAASIRMIAAEGGFEHGIIRYYFPNKADLFKTVLTIISDEYYEVNKSWLKGVEVMSPSKGFSLYLDRFLEYNFKHPDVIGVLVQNLSQSDKSEFIPGYQIITDMLAQNKQVVEEHIPFNAPREEIHMFIDSFNALVFTYIGASSYQATLSGINRDSKKYRKYVKDTLLFILLPILTHLIFPERNDHRRK